MKKRPKTSQSDETPLIREIRSAIADDGRTLYSIAKEAGVEESALRRFMSRERSLSLGSAGLLAMALGLVLVRKSKPKKKSVDHGSSESSRSHLNQCTDESA